MHQPVISCNILALDLGQVLHVLAICLDEHVCFKLLAFILIKFEVVNSSVDLHTSLLADMNKHKHKTHSSRDQCKHGHRNLLLIRLIWKR